MHISGTLFVIINKAGPSIQNTLLTLVNEKVFRNGAQEINVPLRGLIAASNELPEADMGLEALWDRFLVRLLVEGVADRQHFHDLISAPEDSFTPPKPEVQITEAQYAAWQKDIGKVAVPEEIYGLIDLIRLRINEHAQADPEQALYVSDRRWRKIVRLMRTAAFLNGRETVDLMDGFLIASCIWDEPTQIPLVTDWVEDSIRHHGYALTLDLETVKEEIERLRKDVKKETTMKRMESYQELIVEKRDNKEHVIFTQGGEEYWLPKAEWKGLTKTQPNQLQCARVNKGGYRSLEWFNFKKSEKDYSVICDDGEVPVKTVTKAREVLERRVPHDSVVKTWDKQVQAILTQCSNASGQINRYKENELNQLRLNLFVAPEKAEIVESHLEQTLQDIAGMEVEVKKVQDEYQNLKKEGLTNSKQSPPAKLNPAQS